MHDSYKVERLKITLIGMLQGIGFRPFIYRLARESCLSGWVRNTRSGVEIECEGDAGALERFVRNIPEKAPPVARIDNLGVKRLPVRNSRAFRIRSSTSDTADIVRVTPDLALCDECRKELLSSKNRRIHYPFINCTNCGPRLSIVKDVPYDRARTTMKRFTMCPDCQKEYENPVDRRYHAQPNACPACGPRMRLMYRKREWEGEKALAKARALLVSGKVVAVKGLGGYHLACDALNEHAVETLRFRKYREDKPFAIMARDFAVARRFCRSTPDEIALLGDYKSPIVLLPRKTKCPIAEAVAPGNPYLGVMLPYSPLHVLLFEDGLEALVMTSGNMSQEPIAFKNEDALIRLAPIADAFLIHNREIERRVDDSVVRIVNGVPQILRRSRGYAPAPIPLPLTVPPILACGAELKGTFCLAKGASAYVSHHIGDLENMETLESYERAIEDYQRLLRIKPVYIVHDLHPDYLSTKFAQQRAAKDSGRQIKRVIIAQHHHAHIAGVMLQHNLKGKVIGIAFDGTGYGSDGTIWGGEALICSYDTFERFAHLKLISLPGGDSAIKQPWKIATVYLHHIFGNDLETLDIPFSVSLKQRDYSVILDMVKKNLNTPKTSSMGRLFDAVSALLSVRETVNYEAQGAIELEYLATRSRTKTHYPFRIHSDSIPMIIDVDNTIRAIVSDLEKKRNRATIARKFHNTISLIVLESARLARKRFRLNKVALSGGCFQNLILLKETKRLLETDGFMVYTDVLVPPNDGGISLGQIALAAARIDGSDSKTFS